MVFDDLIAGTVIRRTGPKGCVETSAGGELEDREVIDTRVRLGVRVVGLGISDGNDGAVGQNAQVAQVFRHAYGVWGLCWCDVFVETDKRASSGPEACIYIASSDSVAYVCVGMETGDGKVFRTGRFICFGSILTTNGDNHSGVINSYALNVAQVRVDVNPVVVDVATE